MKIREGYGMTRDGRKVRIERNGGCEEFPFCHDHGEGSFHGLTAEGMSCVESRNDDIISMIDDDAPGPVRTVTRREIVDGVYGHVEVGTVTNDPLSPRVMVFIGVRGAGGILLNADELRSAAMVLSQIAEALDDKETTK